MRTHCNCESKTEISFSNYFLLEEGLKKKRKNIKKCRINFKIDKYALFF